MVMYLTRTVDPPGDIYKQLIDLGLTGPSTRTHTPYTVPPQTHKSTSWYPETPHPRESPTVRYNPSKCVVKVGTAMGSNLVIVTGLPPNYVPVTPNVCPET